MTVLALLGGEEASVCPFFQPGLLQDQLEQGLRADEAEREPALAIADRLAGLLERYALSVENTLDAYAEFSSSPTANSTELIQRLQPIDRERQETMKEIIEIRQRLVELLDGDQWRRVFEQ